VPVENSVVDESLGGHPGIFPRSFFFVGGDQRIKNNYREATSHELS